MTDSPPLPQPLRPRWQPLRLGLVDIFHYDDEEIWLRDGNPGGKRGKGSEPFLGTWWIMPCVNVVIHQKPGDEPAERPNSSPEACLIRHVTNLYRRSTMHMSKLILGTAAAVVFASAVSAAGLTASESMSCKLTNVAKDVALYDGACTVTQEVTGTSNLYKVEMGSGEPFLFATSDGKTWMHGPERVQFRDLGKGAIFKWGDFALAVAE